ncbi:Pex19 protein [Scleroderma yunnanense]
MASFMRELDVDEKGNEGQGEEGEEGRKRMLKAAWESMLIKEMDSMGAGTSGASHSSLSSTSQLKPASTDQAASKRPTTSTEFQSRIRNTMDKMKSSESNLTPPPPSSTSGELDELAALFQNLGQMNPGNSAEENIDPNAEKELTSMLEQMMGQLMSKEVLYEPLKELDEKFPSYLESHSTLSSEDQERYQKQISCIKQLLEIFEAPAYNEEDEETKKKIMDIMSELQAHGSPPEEIMGSVPPGFSLGPDGLPELPEGCVVS